MNQRSELGTFRTGIWKFMGLWGRIKRGTCPLCRGEKNVIHILPNCRKTQRWRTKFTETKLLMTKEGRAYKKIVGAPKLRI